MDKEQRVTEADGEEHDSVQGDLVSLLDQVNAVEQPVGEYEDEEDEQDQGTQSVYPGGSRPGFPHENRPRPNGQDDDLARERQERAVALGAAPELLGRELQHAGLGQGDHDHGAQDADEGQDGGEGVPAPTLALEAQAGVDVDRVPLERDVLHRTADVRRVAGHGGRVVAPVVVLREQEKQPEIPINDQSLKCLLKLTK